ncbi:hypothetical protein A3C87_03620 [Candidatus Kaiserbacteria bacterium RIFCSPHIGHO2_02_FULL_49_34]|uniref:Gluconeogenesis factor n=1 Tax=Candidatus Kaiserbacteria bacterium RIFCSPHIGHO2_02_FULL_49_34 TaxID=1798491 RepID=A0A1F6DIG2_9BACT|nr:MAG: hypothetical protein A3C87_03620 [Candidatus Kaiserbacteria bacterium RIFCSPHIGHO2_02_FULL_49_34]
MLPCIVTLSGGSGGYTLIRGLVEYPLDITSIATVFDDGGSTGVIRDAYGALPQGDLRRCILAQLRGDPHWRELFTHRFQEKFLDDHSLGNIMLLAAEELWGRERAAATLAKMLGAQGRVLPISTDDSRLIATMDDGSTITGESNIDKRNIRHDARAISRMRLSKRATIHKEAHTALMEAEYIIIGPGDLYTSLVPILLVRGAAETINASPAKLIYVANLMTKPAETANYSTDDFLQAFRTHGLERDITVVVSAHDDIPKNLITTYWEKELATPVRMHDAAAFAHYALRNHTAPLISSRAAAEGIIRHSSHKLGRAIMDIIEENTYGRHLVIDLDDTLAETHLRLQGDVSRISELTLAPHALEFLLSYQGRRVLLSTGDEELQRKKIAHLGIEKFFDAIHIVPTPEAKSLMLASYVKIVGDAKRVDVVGDRVDVEICYGMRLRCRTVRVALPGAHYAHVVPTEEQTPDATVTNFVALMNLLVPS